MVPGRSYTDAESAALPKIKSFSWKAAVPGLGHVVPARTEKKSYVRRRPVCLPEGPGSTWQGALQKIGIYASSAKAKPLAKGGASYRAFFQGRKVDWLLLQVLTSKP